MDFLHNIAYIENFLMHVSNLFFAKNFLHSQARNHLKSFFLAFESQKW